MKIATLLLVSFFFLMELSAQETQKRTDSVRKVIDNFAKLQDKEISETDKIKKMFKKGEASGQLKLIYSTTPDTQEAYATAIGGIMKYELATYRGFNAGAAAYVSYDIPFASGEGTKRSSELSSSEGDYMDMGEAYLNYRYENLNFRGGRQVLDTPLADSDDIRMIQNSFEAYILSYEYNGIEFMAGNLQSWSGYDAGLDETWTKTGSDGVNFAGVTYADSLEFDTWFYNITGMANTAYFDLGVEYKINAELLIRTMLQYLHQRELDNSGVEATIYGLLAELVIGNLGLNISLNKSEKHQNKESFSGFGGGALFTNMDTMIIDEIAKDREALSYVAGFSYHYKELSFLYAYGDFSGDEDSNGIKAHIVEQNIAMGYNINEEFVVGVLLARQENVEDTQSSWNRAQVKLNYNFK